MIHEDTLHERESRLLQKLSSAPQDANIKQDTPDKLSVIRGDIGREKGTNKWREQAGQEFHLNRGQIKEVIRGRLRNVFEGVQRRNIALEARREWDRTRKYEWQLKAEGRRPRESRGKYLARWHLQHAEKVDDLRQYIGQYTEREKTERSGVSAFMGFENAEELEHALDNAVESVVNEERFQRGVVSYKEVLELAFQRVGESLRYERDELALLTSGERDIPDEFKDLWKRGADGVPRLHVPGIYHHGTLMREASEGFGAFTGKTDRSYRYANEVAMMDPKQWRRIDEAFDLKNRMDTYEVEEKDEEGKSIKREIPFSELLRRRMGINVADKDLFASVRYLPLQTEKAGVVGEGYKAEVVAFQIPEYVIPEGKKKARAVEHERGSRETLGGQGIIVFEDGEIADVRYFSATDEVVSFAKRNPDQFEPFFDRRTWSFIQDFDTRPKADMKIDDFNPLDYDNRRLSGIERKIERITQLHDSGESAFVLGGGQEGEEKLRKAVRGEAYRHLHIAQQEKLATSIAEYLKNQPDTDEVYEEVRTYFVDVLSADEGVFVNNIFANIQDAMK